MQMKFYSLFIALSFAAKQSINVTERDGNNKANKYGNGEKELNLVKIEEDEYIKKHLKSSHYFGVKYDAGRSKWKVERRSKHEKKMVYHGSYENEKIAAHASDTLARKLVQNGEKSHKLNFYDDEAEVFPEKKRTSSQYIGVSYIGSTSKWQAHRYSKHEQKMIHNGCYKNEETAAHASDTSARKLMANGEKSHKLNFPDDETEVFSEKTTSSQFIGVGYDVKHTKWQARRYSKHEQKIMTNGSYDNEDKAAHASDTLARILMQNGEKGHKLNFPKDETEVFPVRQRKRKRPHSEDLDYSQNN